MQCRWVTPSFWGGFLHPKGWQEGFGWSGVSPGQLPLEGCMSLAFQLSEPALG